MKRILIVVLISLLLVGCVSGVRTKNLNVHWKFQEGKSTLSAEYAKDHSRVGVVGRRNLITIIADVDGKTDGEFNFIVESINPYEKVANNVLKIEPLYEERGTVIVESEGITKEVDYDIFGLGIVRRGWDNRGVPYEVSGFNFAAGEEIRGGMGDLNLYSDGKDRLHGKFAEAQPLDGFYDHLRAVNDLDELEYKDGTIDLEDRWGKIFFVKCEVGYAAFVYSQGLNFVYKYSETGKF